MRDRQQPPLDEYEPSRERRGVLDLEPRWVVGNVLEREWWIPIRTESAVAVEADAPRPTKDADVEVEQRPRVAARDQDREERDDAHADEREPEEEEHDEVRNREQPLHEPEPAAQSGCKIASETDRICRPVRFHIENLSVADQTTGT